jgi:hypothetical protein
MEQNELIPVLSPGNDLSFVAKLWKSQGAGKVALTDSDGSASGWISIAPATDTLADAALTVDVTWLADTKAPELWRVSYNATPSGATALRSLFSGVGKPTPYLVVLHTAGVRRVAMLEYRDYDYFSVS